jgi:hypothetical protein
MGNNYSDFTLKNIICRQISPPPLKQVQDKVPCIPNNILLRFSDASFSHMAAMFQTTEMKYQ